MESKLIQKIGTGRRAVATTMYMKMRKWLWSWVMDRGWKNFEQVSKGLCCSEQSKMWQGGWCLGRAQKTV
jgi:hypothetical protein